MDNLMSLEKKVDNFAKNTMMESQRKSQMLGNTMSQITNFSSIR